MKEGATPYEMLCFITGMRAGYLFSHKFQKNFDIDNGGVESETKNRDLEESLYEIFLTSVDREKILEKGSVSEDDTVEVFMNYLNMYKKIIKE